MPMLYRHIGAPSAAVAAGNGKPVYRGLAPSHQAAMRFGLEFDGTIDVTPMFEPGRALDGDNPADFASLAFSDSEINTALAATGGDHDKTHQYYNEAACPNLIFDMGRATYYWYDSQGDVIKTMPEFRAEAGLVWGVADWYWEARLDIFLGIHNIVEGTTSVLSFTRLSSYIVYRSTPSAQNIRLGNGTTLYFDGVYGSGALDGASDVFGSTRLILSAQYA